MASAVAVVETGLPEMHACHTVERTSLDPFGPDGGGELYVTFKHPCVTLLAVIKPVTG